MPGLSSYTDVERGHARNGPYSPNGYDPYRRDEFYRDEDPYRREIVRDEALSRSHRNGYGNNTELLERSSLDERIGAMKEELVFEADHLATYTSRSGPMTPEDGLRKLRQMENNTGIWTMRCFMVIDRKHVIIQDKGTGDELDRFPIDMVYEPTAILKNDRREVYNNLVLFSVVDDPRKRGSVDMHIFQSISSPAQEIVDEVLNAKEGRGRVSSTVQRPQPPPPPPQQSEPSRYSGMSSKKTKSYRNITTSGSLRSTDRGAHYAKHIVRDVPQRDYVIEREYVRARTPSPPRREQIIVRDLPPDQDYIVGRSGGGYLVEDNYSKPLNQSQRPMGYRASYIREREDLDTGQNEALERDVQLLNNCFDDIEKFVARLQQAAEAYKELERRKRDHGGRNKKRAIGEGMLTLRSRPPPSEDFIDIFQKFKFAFCVLSKLKAHIHDPNAPELVHFLFTPLSLIYEASRDPVHRGIDLADKAVSPILTLDAKQLLLNCLTSKELELWQALGKNWTISKDEYRGYSPPYTPRFYDGWQPSPMSEERERPEFNTTAMAHAAQIERRALEDKAREHAAERIVPFPPADDNRRAPKEFPAEYSRVHHSRDRLEDYRSPTPPPVVYSSPPVAIYNENKSAYKPSDEPPVMTGSHSDENAFARDLKRMGASVSEVKFERAGRNAKELTVERGEILQVLDSSRNWWKVKNVRGQTGYVPYTILKDLDDDRYDKQDTGERRLSGSYNSYIAENYSTSAPAPPPVPDSSPRREEEQLPTRRSTPEKQLVIEKAAPALGPTLPSRLSDTSSPDTYCDTTTPSQSPGLHHHKGHSHVMERNIHHDDLRHELRDRMNVGSMDSNESKKQNIRRYAGAVHLTRHSEPEEVQEWLEVKGFSPYCLRTLESYCGQELFEMQRKEMERLLERDEAHRLDSQLTVQKNISGFGTRGASELNAILRRRKEHADAVTKPDVLGQPPDFSPGTPDYSTDDSDGCSDDFADAGKTLRDLLLRQRHKLQSLDYSSSQNKN